MSKYKLSKTILIDETGGKSNKTFTSWRLTSYSFHKRDNIS